MGPVIRVDSVTRTYGAITAVDDITFGVERGQVVGFVGPNGAGKSTTLKMLATFLRPTAGTVAVDGFDTVADPLEVRRRIGYLPGDTPLYRDMIVADLVRFVAGAHGLAGADLQVAMSRAIGETMIVAIAAGSNPDFTLNPLVPIQTMTGYIVQVILGDAPTGTLAHKTIFAVGTSLFLITLGMNLVSQAVVRRYREAYE
mgnify:CR=1 FL=1